VERKPVGRSGIERLSSRGRDMLNMQTDPIFAAIKHHKKTQTRLHEACRLTDAVLAKQEGRKTAWAETAAFKAADDAEAAATDFLLQTPPSSVEGVRAAIKHFIELGEPFGHDPDVVHRFLATLLRSPALRA
jgi:hypothetical protein